MTDEIYKGIGRVSDTFVYELLPKLQKLSLEGQDSDGELIWAGHQDTIKEVEEEINNHNK